MSKFNYNPTTGLTSWEFINPHDIREVPFPVFTNHKPENFKKIITLKKWYQKSKIIKQNDRSYPSESLKP